MGNLCRWAGVYIQNDQRVMGIILRYVWWGTHRPPPPRSPAVDRPTRRPSRFGSTKGGGGFRFRFNVT